jgi:hypothetical protein
VAPAGGSEALRRRSADLIAQLTQANRAWTRVSAASRKPEQRRLAAGGELAEVERQIPAEISNQLQAVTTAQRKLVVAESELANAEERKQAEIERAVSAAPVRAAADMLLTGIGDPNIADIEQAVRELVVETKSAYARWVPILLGLVVLGIGASPRSAAPGTSPGRPANPRSSLPSSTPPWRQGPSF